MALMPNGTTEESQLYLISPSLPKIFTISTSQPFTIYSEAFDFLIPSYIRGCEMSISDWTTIISAVTTSSLNILLIYQLIKHEKKRNQEEKNHTN